MRILYLTQWFAPEPNIIKGTAFVRALAAAGCAVTVVTGLPNYPTGRLYPGYRIRPIQRERIDGVEVIRLPLYPSHDASALRRSLNYLSFFLSALAWLLLRRQRFDLAYVYHPPITVGLAAALAGLVRPLPFVLDVQDLWPDTIAATDMAGAGWLVGPLGAVCRFVYARAAAIVAQSERMRDALMARGVPPAKATTIRNWADGDSHPVAVPARPADRFTFVYAGNLGRAQGLEAAISAVARAGRGELLLYGDGIEAGRLREHAARIGAPVRFMGRVPQAEIATTFAQADALLLHLRDDPLFAMTIPSKTQAYLAAGRPIVAGVAGEAADLLACSGAALIARPGDEAALVAAMVAMAEMPREQREAMGAAGRLFYAKRLAFDRGVARTIAVLRGTYRETPEGDRTAPS